MKITKYVHACLLVENENVVALFDPGAMTQKSGMLIAKNLPKLDYLIITHEHFDHFSEDLVKELLAEFTNLKIITTPALAEKLKVSGITASSEGDDNVVIFTAPHESMEPLGVIPQNIGVHFMNSFTHPGDSYSFSESKKVLALPLAGPWGATIDGIRLATKLKPSAVVPIHDWMWNDDWRNTMHERFEAYFKEQGIRFIKPVNGEPVEV